MFIKKRFSWGLFVILKIFPIWKIYFLRYQISDSCFSNLENFLRHQTFDIVPHLENFPRYRTFYTIFPTWKFFLHKIFYTYNFSTL